MNRKIIFRGKRVDNGEWVYGRGLQQCKDELGNEIVAIFKNVVKSKNCIKKKGRHTLYYVPVKAETLGQFTGLKDKNGKNIFEGDIVTIGNNLKAVVIWFNGSFRFQDELSSKATYFDDIGVIMRDYDVQVIGNIHDNPELLSN